MLIAPHIRPEYIKPKAEYLPVLGNPFDLPLNLDDSGIDAVEEMIIFCDFLSHHSKNKATLANYTKEIERFSQWLWRKKRKGLLKINKEDAEDYLCFVQSPPYHWVSRRGRHSKFIAGVENSLWRPFSSNSDGMYKPTYQSNRSTISCMKVFYNYLIEQEITQINPFSIIKNPLMK